MKLSLMRSFNGSSGRCNKTESGGIGKWLVASGRVGTRGTVGLRSRATGVARLENSFC